MNCDGFKFISNNREKRQGGGVGLFVWDDIPFVVKKQLSKHDQEMTFESICIECVIDNRKVLVCVVYRSPSASLQEFLRIYECFIEDVTNLNSEQVLVMGDFNINLLLAQTNRPGISNHLHEKSLEFLCMNLSKSLLPSCRSATRVTEDTATLIDNIFSTIPVTLSHIIFTDVSDHCVVVADVGINHRPKFSEFKQTRKIDKEGMDKLRNLLYLNEWTAILECECPEISTALFLKYFRECLDEACPLRRIKIKKYTLPKKPWISRGLLNSISIKNKLFKISVSFPSTKNKEEFKKYKNVLTQLIRKAKARYFEKSFVEARGDQKHTWRLINSLLGRSQKSSFPNEMLRGDGTFSSDKQEIVNLLNAHFVSIGEKTANASHVSPNNNNNDLFKDHMSPPSDKSMLLSPVTEIELKQIISKMKNGSSEALDGSSTNLVKEIFPVISPVLSHIINLIFVTATGVSSIDTQFADDTAATVSGKSREELVVNLTSAYDRLSTWLSDNRLLLNRKKTKFIVYSRTGHKFPDIESVSISANEPESVIERVVLIRYLGVVFDENLSWKEQINQALVYYSEHTQ
ncbi:uncharacterized protein LOC136037555 [Artemia franciscana]|uniref:uncharacterized protein LOC136037555 n=1 Tax=Artemia franciscana TaxID=6661 RepID=UPI0032DAF40E